MPLGLDRIYIHTHAHTSHTSLTIYTPSLTIADTHLFFTSSYQHDDNGDNDCDNDIDSDNEYDNTQAFGNFSSPYYEQFLAIFVTI